MQEIGADEIGKEVDTCMSLSKNCLEGPRGPDTLQCGHCTDVIHSHTDRQNIHIHRKK